MKPIEELQEDKDLDFYSRLKSIRNNMSDEDQKTFDETVSKFYAAKKEKRYDEMNKYQQVMDEIIERSLSTVIEKLEFYKKLLDMFNRDKINFTTLDSGVEKLVNAERKEFLQGKIMFWEKQNTNEMDNIMGEISTEILPEDAPYVENVGEWPEEKWQKYIEETIKGFSYERIEDFMDELGIEESEIGENSLEEVEGTEIPIISADEVEGTKVPVISADEVEGTKVPVISAEEVEGTEVPVISAEEVEETEIPVISAEEVEETEVPVISVEEVEGTEVPIISEDEAEGIVEAEFSEIPEEEIESEETENTETKIKLSEHYILSAQEKLIKLREKFEKNPPKTSLGKKIASTKLNILKTNIDRAIIKNNLKTLAEKGLHSRYQDYTEALNVLEEQIANLELDTKNMETEIERLDNLNPSSKKSIFAKDNKRKLKNMPKGYKTTGTERKEDEESKREELSKAVQENKKLIADKKALMLDLHTLYEQEKAKQAESLRKDLAVIKPNVFKQIGKFLREKVQQFNEWRIRKNKEAQLKLEESVKGSEGSTKRKVMLEDLASVYTPEEQNEFASETYKLIEEKKNENRTDEEKLEENNK